MARPLPNLPTHKLSSLPVSVTSFFVLMAIFSLLSVVAFLCSSHKHRKVQHKQETTEQLGGQKRLISKLQSNLNSKAMTMAKMISWRKVQDAGDQEEVTEADEEALWRRTIIMGERCRPIDFSGKILYDSQGNLLPDSPHDLSHSKSAASTERS